VVVTTDVDVLADNELGRDVFVTTFVEVTSIG
jgi:hypothetical protein